MLAEKLGKTKTQLLFEISSEELTGWMIEYKLRKEDKRREENKNRNKKR